MTYAVEVLGNLERKMTITVPFQPLETEIEERLNMLARTAEFEGYRPGKAPMHLVNKRYGDKLRVDIYSGSVESSFGKAIEEIKLRVAGFPEIEHMPFVDGDVAFQYTATFEVFPDVIIGDFAKVKIERPVYKLIDADVKKALDIIVKQQVTYELVERAAKKGDRINVRIKSSIDNIIVESTDDSGIDLVLGETGRLESFDSQLIGAKAGAAKQFEITYPADHKPQELAGKVAHYDFFCNSVSQPILPKINAEFSIGIGIGVEYGDVNTMKVEVAEILQQEVSKRINDKLKENVFQALLDKADFDIPRALIGVEMNRVMQVAEQSFKGRGVESRNINLDPAMFESQAKRTTKLRLILNEVINANNLHANEDQVLEMVGLLAQEFDDPTEVIAWYYAKADRLEKPAALASEQNAVDWVLSSAKVINKKMNFDELMGSV
ncbi:MAG: trigger factor [Methylococcaceae bacterium]|nr:trigger factor [Methylococcaceae bacterium]